ncbi:hypothetical protein HOY82DRAFT_572105 [Tuber indicum]|nr:hypothetical protein HOY82DRAFT_572105 [Tuber indicum]
MFGCPLFFLVLYYLRFKFSLNSSPRLHATLPSLSLLYHKLSTNDIFYQASLYNKIPDTAISQFLFRNPWISTSGHPNRP